MEQDITNFLLKYPNIDNFDDNILNPYEEDFYEVIYKKKEFYENRLEKFEQIPKKIGSLMKHQKLIARFFRQTHCTTNFYYCMKWELENHAQQ